MAKIDFIADMWRKPYFSAPLELAKYLKEALGFDFTDHADSMLQRLEI